MDEAARILLDFFREHQIQAGIVATLHTFGSQLEFNPHVHLVVTMGGLTKDGKWKDYDYFPFAMLRKYWQNAVLKLIRRTLYGIRHGSSRFYKRRTRKMQRFFTCKKEPNFSQKDIRIYQSLYETWSYCFKSYPFVRWENSDVLLSR